jgi:hypothetical protein
MQALASGCFGGFSEVSPFKRLDDFEHEADVGGEYDSEA